LKIAPYSAGSSQLHNFSQYMAATDLTQVPFNSWQEFCSFVEVRVHEYAQITERSVGNMERHISVY